MLVQCSECGQRLVAIMATDFAVPPKLIPFIPIHRVVRTPSLWPVSQVCKRAYMVPLPAEVVPAPPSPPSGD